MSNLKLVFPDYQYREEWYSIVKEIEDANEKMTPFALKGETNDYNIYLKNVHSNSN